MSRRLGTAVRATRKPVIVVAGEDANDRECLKVIGEAICPDAAGRVVPINQTVRLCRATSKVLDQRVDRLVNLARARAAREDSDMAALVVHEDLDEVDSHARKLTLNRVRLALKNSVDPAVYALAAEEVEAWLLLFPDALEEYVQGWKVPKALRGEDTGLVQDPKGELRRRVSTGTRRYEESDSPQILQRVVKRSGLSSYSGSNGSWVDMLADVENLAKQLHTAR